MQILECTGHELEKAQPNTSEDFFNRSEVKFIEDGEEKIFQLLYIRFFDEVFSEFTPFEQNPIFTFGDKEVNFKDIVAIVCLLKNPSFRQRKRVYINTQKEFAQYFEDVNYEKLKELFKQVVEQGSYELTSPLLVIEQN
jgi:hypothetical protein